MQLPGRHKKCAVFHKQCVARIELLTEVLWSMISRPAPIMKTRIVPMTLMPRAGAALTESSALSSGFRFAFSAAWLVLFSLAWPAQAQTSCPGSETCTGVVAQMVCPAPGTTLAGNDVTFTWCNAGADYFLQIESIPGAHDIFYALVSFQNFVHLINLPTNGVTVYVALWTQVHGTWQTPLQYSYTAASPPPRLLAPVLGTNGQFQFTLSEVTPGRTNVVQGSPDLFSWTAISTNVAVSNSFPFIDAAPANLNTRFYRAFETR